MNAKKYANYFEGFFVGPRNSPAIADSYKLGLQAVDADEVSRLTRFGILFVVAPTHCVTILDGQAAANRRVYAVKENGKWSADRRVPHG